MGVPCGHPLQPHASSLSALIGCVIFLTSNCRDQGWSMDDGRWTMATLREGRGGMQCSLKLLATESSIQYHRKDIPRCLSTFEQQPVSWSGPSIPRPLLPCEQYHHCQKTQPSTHHQTHVCWYIPGPPSHKGSPEVTLLAGEDCANGLFWEPGKEGSKYGQTDASTCSTLSTEAKRFGSV
jgi:hypothetical protein